MVVTLRVTSVVFLLPPLMAAIIIMSNTTPPITQTIGLLYHIAAPGADVVVVEVVVCVLLLPDCEASCPKAYAAPIRHITNMKAFWLRLIILFFISLAFSIF